MAKRARVHSRDLQPLIVAPKGMFAAARVQRFDWPANIPTTEIDELGRKLHVGITQEIPEVTVTVEAFDVSHETFAYLTGYDAGTYPVSGASVTEFKNVDVVGHIRDASTQNVLNSLYVKRGIVTAMDATFGVRDNSSVTYTVTSNSKKELKQPVVCDVLTISAASGVTLSQTPTFLVRTSGYILDCYSNTSNTFLNEGTDFTISAKNITFTNPTIGDSVWVTYCANVSQKFAALNNTAPAAIPGKYVPLTISVSSVPRVQSATVRCAMNAESIFEMGGLGKPVGTETGIPSVTGDITVLKTDNDLLQLLTGQTSDAVESDIEWARKDLPLKIQLKNPNNPDEIVLTYYIPTITITSESDTDSVNQSMTETFGWESVTGECYVASGAGPW